MGGETEYLAINSPDRANHLWRYTPWHRIHPTGQVDQIPQCDNPILISLNLLSGGEAPRGVRLSAIESDLARDVNDDVAAAFIRSLNASTNIRMEIDEDVVVEEPLLLTIQSGGNGEISSMQIDIIAGANSEVELLTVIDGEADWFGLLRTVQVRRGANFCGTLLNRTSRGRVVRVEQFDLSRDSQTRLGTVNLGGERTKADIRCNLNGRGAHLLVNGSVVSDGQQHNDHHIEIEHHQADTFSRLNWHSSCSDRSRTIGTGMLKITKGAKGSDSAQKFNNLLLSRDSEADSIPELEVLENEVVGCGHGTASGPVDEEQMFYLKSRGFSDNEAEAILVSAFLNSTLKEMGSEQLHDFLNKMVGEAGTWIDNGMAIGGE